eukprot:gene5748-9569_t
MNNEDLYIEYPELKAKKEEFFGKELSGEDEPPRYEKEEIYQKYRSILMKDTGTGSINGETTSTINISEKDLQYCPFSYLKSTCLRNFIPTDGIEDYDYKTIHELILKNKGKLIKAPLWYKPPPIQIGPRRIGLEACCRIGCSRTENENDHFKACGGCHVPFYCSKECQTVDWKFRHKKVCKKSQKQREKMKKVSGMLEMFSGLK